MGHKSSARESIEDEIHAKKLSTKLGIKGMLNLAFLLFLITMIFTVLGGK